MYLTHKSRKIKEIQIFPEIRQIQHSRVDFMCEMNKRKNRKIKIDKFWDDHIDAIEFFNVTQKDYPLLRIPQQSNCTKYFFL